MRCGNCGKELTHEDKFCSRCGTAAPSQDVFCSQCGKKLTAEDRFCNQCGTAVKNQDKPGSQSVNGKMHRAAPGSSGKTVTSGVRGSEWPLSYGNREDLLLELARDRFQIATYDFLDDKLSGRNSDPRLGQGNVNSAAREMVHLAALKRIDSGIQQTPEPVTAAERRAYWQEALALIERLITPEAKVMDKKGYEINVSKRDALRRAIKKADSGKMTSRVVFCPHCHKWTDTDFTHCVHCYKGMNQYASRPVPQAGGQSASAAASHTAPGTAFTAPAQAAPGSADASQPQAGAAQVHYADNSLKDWGKFPGEKSVRGRHIIGLLQPNGGKFTYHMEVTDRRILLWRESSGSSTFGNVARMGGGLLGSLIAEGVKAATGAGPKPWLEIPLTAISNCGMWNGSDFFIVADQTYVLKNMKYDKFLPDLVANAQK